MNVSEAETIFERRLAEANVRLDNVSAATGFGLMFAFYREQRADDCPLDADGDMLLYEWGTYDWGQGEFFNLSLTRQFILEGTSEDENILQLSLKFKFTPDDALRSITLRFVMRASRLCSSAIATGERSRSPWAASSGSIFAAASTPAAVKTFDVASSARPLAKSSWTNASV